MYGLVLFSLDILVVCFPWIATMRYDYKICPPDLVSTMVAMAFTFQFVIGEKYCVTGHQLVLKPSDRTKITSL